MAAEQTDCVRLIEPQPCLNPNVPPGTQHFQLSPISLVPWSTLPSVLVLERRLAEDRLEAAISELAGWYPVLAGRYVSRPRPGADLSDYAIHLDGSCIPLHTSTVEVDHSYAFPTQNVVQPLLAPYVPSLEPGMSTADSGARLAAFQHTMIIPSQRSVLGLTISHTLVDGASCSKMLHDLAFLYTHPGSPLPEPPHFFAKVIYPQWPPPTSVKEQFQTNLLVPTAVSDVMEEFQAAAAVSDPVHLELSMAEVAAIRHPVQAASGEFVSEQDALTGWWVDGIEQLGEDRIETATYIMNYRSLYPGQPGFPRELKTQHTTVAQVRDIHIGTPLTTGGLERWRGVAKAIRAEIEHLKADPEYGRAWLSNAAYWHEVAAQEGKSFNYIPPPGVAIINSNMRYDWTPDFGIGPSRYHTTFCARRFLRVFRRNNAEGSPTGIELAFCVRKGQAGKALEAFAEFRRRMQDGATDGYSGRPRDTMII